MIPPDYFLFLQKQRHQEMVRQAEQARLVRASRQQPAVGERVFQHVLRWVGGALLSWGCALHAAGRATEGTEKGCCVCL